ncbi:CPCC family cysteine-rich protein [Halopseudomonas pachastrellae]|nr:CPCC family cysteine-rich protein [Halopseudomonas pachastrellae]
MSSSASYEICSVCFWEDDGVRDEHTISGPTRRPLATARQNLAEFGACDLASVDRVDRQARERYRAPEPLETDSCPQRLMAKVSHERTLSAHSVSRPCAESGVVSESPLRRLLRSPRRVYLLEAVVCFGPLVVLLGLGLVQLPLVFAAVSRRPLPGCLRRC